MPVIGIIDDRAEARKLMADRFEIALTEEWRVVVSEPLADLKDHISWIAANKVCALVIDERLNEVATNEQEGTVTYHGHDLVDYLRLRIKTLPIFVVTAWPRDPSLLERFKDVEDIIPRNNFFTKSNDYVLRITRASQKYVDTFEAELAEISKFAYDLATGKEATLAEVNRIRAIQQKLETAFSIESIQTKSQWLTQLEHTLLELEELKAEIEKHLENL